MFRNPFSATVLTLSLLGLVAQAGASELEDAPYGGPARIEVARPDLVRSVGAQVDPTTNGASPATSASEAQALGVKWLLQHQRSDGGWGAGSWGSDNLSAPSDVATTAYVSLALLRDANRTGKHDAALERSVSFVVGAIETAPKDTPLLNTPQGTQPQHKLGQYVDTHLAAMLLGEIDGHLSPALNRRVAVAYDTVLTKVQRAQNANGSFESSGWAPILSSSIASQSLYKAKENGKDVADEVLQRAETYQAALATPSGTFDASSGAGVELYAVASGLRTNDQAARRARDAGEAEPTAVSEARGAASTRVAADADGRLVAGFGSIGGEEMLSYQMISDTLAESGGAEWDQWNQRIGQYLMSIQGRDGSWSGHHCITSTVFTTAGALMTLSSGDWYRAARASRTSPRG